MLNIVKVFSLCAFALTSASPYDEPISLAVYRLLQQAEGQSGFSDANDLVDVVRRPVDDVRALDQLGNVGSSANGVEWSESLGSPEVQVKQGVVMGSTFPESHAFFSVPFGKPPVGDKRFMEPEEAENFSGPFNATTPDGKMCYQVRNESYYPMMSEDCLVLNVYVPTSVDLSDSAAPPSDRLPVLVWFYGGFFFRGRATTFKSDGRWLSQAANAVVVNVNYRVGPLGFLIFEENGSLIKGNQGLKDQQLGLQWVQDNIAKFGGDPDRVTIFGNSAGAQSIHFHLVSESSRNLFNRAIMQSNPAVFPYHNAEESLVITDRVATAVGRMCSKDVATCLRNADPIEITNTRNEVMIKSLLSGDFYSGIEPFRPYIDGVEFSDQPLNLMQLGSWHTDKEVIVGTNNEEMSYVTEVVRLFPKFTEENFVAVNKLMLGEEDGATISKVYIDAYSPSLNYSEILGQEVTDMFFICPNRALARFASRTSTSTNQGHPPVYVYNDAYALNQESCEKIMDFPPVCGTAFHSSEIIFVFKSDEGYGTNFTESDQVVSDMFTTYWGGFANTGVPSSGLTTSLGDFTEWPAYTESVNGDVEAWTNIRIRGGQSATETSFRQEFCDAWDALDYYVTRLPASNETSTEPPHSSATATSNGAPDSSTGQDPTTGQVSSTVMVKTSTTAPTPTSTLGATETTSGATANRSVRRAVAMALAVVCASALTF